MSNDERPLSQKDLEQLERLQARFNAQEVVKYLPLEQAMQDFDNALDAAQAVITDTEDLKLLGQWQRQVRVFRPVVQKRIDRFKPSVAAETADD